MITNDIRGEIEKQSVFASGESFICKGCANYKGGCGCEKDIFIAFAGGNTSSCVYFVTGKECPHCGRKV